MFGRYAVEETILVLLGEMGLHSIQVECIEGPEAFVRFNKVRFNHAVTFASNMLSSHTPLICSGL